MSWYLQNGKDSDVVVSTRIRLVRNIKQIPFVTKCSKEELKKVYDLMKDATISLGYGLKFISMKDSTSLVR